MVEYTTTLPRRSSQDTVRFPVHRCFSVFYAYLFSHYRVCVRVAFGAWRDDFLLIERAGTPPNSPSTLTDTSNTQTPAVGSAARLPSTLRKLATRQLQDSFDAYMSSSSSTSTDSESEEESTFVIGKDDPKEWALSILISLEGKYPGGGSGAMAKKKAAVPLKLSGRRKTVVFKWVADPAAALVPTDARDPITGARVLEPWANLSWKECVHGIMLFFDDKTNDEEKMTEVWDFEWRPGEMLED